MSIYSKYSDIEAVNNYGVAEQVDLSDLIK